MIIAFLLAFIIYFWAAVWIGTNQGVAMENRHWLGGVMFAVGIAPAILFHGDDTGRGFRIALAWALGLIGGLFTAIFMFADAWGLT